MNINIIKPTAAVALVDIARNLEMEGKVVIKLQTGDPDFSTHPSITEAVYKSMQDGNTHYSFSQGLPVLREELAKQINSEIQGNIGKENIVITHGAAEGIFSVMAAWIEPGDEVIILEPGWPTVDSLVLLMGGVPVKINQFLTEELLMEELEKKYSTKTKMICFNTPNNPTGNVLKQSLIDAVCQWAMKKNIFILADEVYRYLQYGETHTTSLHWLKKYSKYIFADSFSKKFAMTGFRIGYICSSPDVIKQILKPSQLTITNVASFIQMGALTALTNPGSLMYASHMQQEYADRKNKLCSFCDHHNIEFVKPEGAFYLFIKLPGSKNDTEFCNELLMQKRVCTVPGSAFGKSGSGYIRVSYANKLETVLKGIEQIIASLP